MNSSEQVGLLASFIRVRQNSVRSVNLERDLDIPLVADGYILTAQFFLRGFVDTVETAAFASHL